MDPARAARPCKVILYTLAGDSLELPLPDDIRVHELKLEVAKHWTIPPLCQKLLHDTTVLPDQMLLCTHGNITCLNNDCDGHRSEDPSVLNLTLTVYVDGALEALNDKDSKARREAVASTTKVASKDYERVTEALCTCCATDPCFLVRQAAEEALIHVARVGDEHIIGVLLARLSLPDCSDRRVVLKTLARIGQGDLHEEASTEGAADAAVWDKGLGLAVVEGLTKFTALDQDGGIVALSTCLDDLLPEVQQAAGQALAGVVQDACAAYGTLQETKDDHIYLKVQMEVSKRLRRNRGMMKLHSLNALVNAATCDDAVAILAVSQCLEESEQELRQAAVLGLSQISSIGNVVAAAAVRDRLRHNSSFVAEAAMEAYQAITSREDALPEFPKDVLTRVRGEPCPPGQSASSERLILGAARVSAEAGHTTSGEIASWTTSLNRWCTRVKDAATAEMVKQQIL